MILHPEIARWIVAVEQERQAELARRVRPRAGASRRRKRRSGEEGA